MGEFIVLTTGIVLVAFVLLQALLGTFIAFRRLAADGVHQRLALREWQHRIRAAELRVAKTEEAKEEWSGWRKFEVRRKQPENQSQDICSFYLYPHDRRPLPPFPQGQFLMVKAEIPDPDDPYQTIEASRCYSLSDSHNARYYRISVKALPAPADATATAAASVSAHLHQHIEEGAFIDVMAPRGAFALDAESSTPVVLVAGGVGITPIMSMINSVVDRKLPRETWLFYGVKNQGDLIMQNAFRHAVEHMPNLRVVYCYSREAPERVEDVRGMGNSSITHYFGRVTIDILKQLLPSNNYDFYLCGPEPMLVSLRDALTGWGVPRNRVYRELFAPPEEDEQASASTARTGPFQVTFAASNKSVKWRGEKNLLSMTNKSNLTVKRIHYTCKQGKCGSCQTAIRTGAVDYPGIQPTFAVQEGFCLPCICVPASDLELEA